MTRTIPILEATADELRAFAQSHLGMSIHPSAKLETVLAKVQAAYFKDTIALPDADEPVELDAQADTDAAPKAVHVQPTNRAAGTSSSHDPKVRLRIEGHEGVGGKRSVPVGVNGVHMLIPRQKEVDVPYRYYLVLKNAVRTHYQQDQETNDMIATEVPAYPFQVVKMPSEEEIEAWHERTRGIRAAA